MSTEERCYCTTECTIWKHCGQPMYVWDGECTFCHKDARERPPPYLHQPTCRYYVQALSPTVKCDCTVLCHNTPEGHKMTVIDGHCETCNITVGELCSHEHRPNCPNYMPEFPPYSGCNCMYERNDGQLWYVDDGSPSRDHYVECSYHPLHEDYLAFRKNYLKRNENNMYRVRLEKGIEFRTYGHKCYTIHGRFD